MEKGLAALISLTLVASFAYAAEQSSDRWTGEWGSYKEAQTESGMRSEGQRLSVTSCVRNTCQAVISTSFLSGEHCDGAGDLRIESDREAKLKLHNDARGKKSCVLFLRLNQADASKRVIAVADKSGDCAAHCTPRCQFQREFVFRSAAPFFGDDIPGCFLARSKALSAVCSDQSLAELQASWSSLSDQTNQLFSQRTDSKERQDEAQGKCSTAEDPGSCLRAFFREDGNRLNKSKAQWQESITRPGDADEAKKKADAIAGLYVRSTRNSTVAPKGDGTKDRLQIDAAASGALHINMSLAFKGHQCGIEGDAAYKANGAFVYQSNENGAACVLEVFAREKGVEFQDPLGGCKSYCGSRESLSGTTFHHSDRKK